jgi:precorrin-6B C5,15-methyltransferase / cobalt-precorrin-6B C5,C15-methyltransferase
VPDRIAVVGVLGAEPAGAAARAALAHADLVVGARRHLEACAPAGAATLAIEGPLADVLDRVAAAAGPVCVLASGDPGFFGIVRALADRIGPERLDVHPAPSSVALAFARLGLPWDDAAVVSAHGRPLAEAVPLAAAAAKVAVLVSPESPPEALGKALLAAGARHRRVVVCSCLGQADEAVAETDLAGLADGTWDPLSVVVLLADGGVAAAPAIRWGRDESAFAHRRGMVTKAEVRAVAIGKLGVPATGVLWDVGAGSGSVAIECAALAPGLSVHAVERRPDDAARIGANAAAHGVTVHVTEGTAPDALDALPDPDRVFLGGGGIAVLDAVLERLRPGGRVVATYAAMDRAVAAADRLGDLVQVSVGRGRPIGGGIRLAAENPVFVVWGPPGGGSVGGSSATPNGEVVDR